MSYWRVVIVSALVFCVCAPASALAASKGVVINLADANDPATQIALQNSGTAWVRLFAPLDHYMAAGKLDANMIAQTASGAQALRARGIKVGMVLTNNPAHLSADPFSPPDPQAWSAAAAQVAAALKDEVDLWEIWNEADADKWWKGADESVGTNAAEYAALLRAAYPVLRAADPTSRVFLGGLTGQNWPYLEKLYAAGAGGYFDGISVHPDTACNLKSPYLRMPQSAGSTRISQWSFLGYREAHATMAANGDGDKPIIMTESGWSTAPGLCPEGAWAGQKNAGVSEAEQASFLLQQFNCLSETPYVESAWWYRIQDGTTTHFTDHYGLWRADGSHKPSWTAYTKVGTPAGELNEDCGDFRPPDISLVSPTPGGQFSGPLLLQASASDASGVSRVGFRYEGGTLGSTLATREQILSGTPPRSLTRNVVWLSAKHLPLGSYNIVVEAVDREGNIARKEIPVTKVDPVLLPPVRTEVDVQLSKPDRFGRRTVSARMRALDPVAWISGYLRVSYQKKVPRRGWVTMHKHGGSPRKLYVHRRLLARGYRWRALVEYLPGAPLLYATKASRSWRVR